MEVKITACTEPPQKSLLDLAPLALLVAFPVLFSPTFASLSHKWSQWTEGLSHGFLLVAIFAYLLYKALPFNSNSTARERVLTGVMLAGASCCWAIFALLDINLLAELTLLACLALAIGHVFGLRSAWRHRFLLALPIYSITLWEHLNGPLVNLSGLMVGEMVRLIDIPAVIDGSSIFIPYGHIVIADGCSGLRYFIIALAMGYLISYLNGYTERGYVAILAVAAVLALISNWLRIFILILVGYFTEMESSLMQEHDMFGWLLFAAICFPAMYFAPVTKPQNTHLDSPIARPKLHHYGVAAILLSAGPLIYWLLPTPNVQPTLNSMLPFQPLNYAPDQLRAEHGDNLGSTHYYQVSADAVLTVSVSQRTSKGQKLVPYLGDLYNKEAWSVAPAITTHQLPVSSSAFVLRAKGSQIRIAQLQWFMVGGLTTASKAKAKLLQIPALLANDNEFVLITLRQRCQQQECSNALAQLTPIAHTLNELLQAQ